jgi:hypothetical protein
MQLTEVASTEEIEQILSDSVPQRREWTNPAASYKLYYATNGTTHCVLAKVHNGPRSIGMFNLYCYERQETNFWRLRALVPVNLFDYTNGVGTELTVENDGRYMRVKFREAIVFTLTCQQYGEVTGETVPQPR